MVNNGVNFYCSSFFFWFILDWLRGDEFDDGVSDFFFSFLTFLVNLEFNFMIIRLLVREAV